MRSFWRLYSCRWKFRSVRCGVASFAAIPFGVALGLKQFPFRRLLLSIVNTCVGLPPVVVGLFVFLSLSRSGPLGSLALLYTPTAMVIAQIILAFPIVASLVQAAVAVSIRRYG